MYVPYELQYLILGTFGAPGGIKSVTDVTASVSPSTAPVYDKKASGDGDSILAGITVRF